MPDSEVPIDIRGRAAAPRTSELPASSFAGRLPGARAGGSFELGGSSSRGKSVEMMPAAAHCGGGPRMELFLERISLVPVGIWIVLSPGRTLAHVRSLCENFCFVLSEVFGVPNRM